ncbi:MAG: OsmC family protein [Verrucomicrobia bacterium]|nr:OsmC family protein [Verrucomicrobiota bacterium]MCF7708674.1 OsmC family protein [Verrucomicrobiota bacterium]
MAVEIKMDYLGELQCSAVHVPSSQKLITDAPVDNGGRGMQFSPTDLAGVALGTCIMTMMGLVAKNNNLDLSGMTARVTKEMSKSPPRRIAELSVIVTIPTGNTLTDATRTKLEKSAHACPVKQSLHPDIKIDIEFVYTPQTDSTTA